MSLQRQYKQALFVTLSILVVGCIVAYGMYNARAQTPPKLVVERFYAGWVRALGEPTGPIEQRLHEKSTYVTADFGREVARENERGRDTVLCGIQDFQVLDVHDAAVNEEGTRAGVDITIGSAEAHAVLIRDERRWWRIDEVDCPNTSSSEPTSMVTE